MARAPGRAPVCVRGETPHRRRLRADVKGRTWGRRSDRDGRTGPGRPQKRWKCATICRILCASISGSPAVVYLFPRCSDTTPGHRNPSGERGEEVGWGGRERRRCCYTSSNLMINLSPDSSQDICPESPGILTSPPHFPPHLI